MSEADFFRLRTADTTNECHDVSNVILMWSKLLLQQPLGKELIIERIGAHVMGNEVLFQKTFNGPLHHTGSKMIALEERTRSQIGGLALLADSHQNFFLLWR